MADPVAGEIAGRDAAARPERRRAKAPKPEKPPRHLKPWKHDDGEELEFSRADIDSARIGIMPPGLDGASTLVAFVASGCGWLSWIVGEHEERMRYFAGRIERDRVVLALTEADVPLAFLGFWVDGRGVARLRASDLAADYGPVRGRWRALLHRLVLTQRRADELYVESFRVRGKARRGGLGSQLLDFAEAEARRLGKTGVRLHVDSENDGGRAFYLARGYREVGGVRVPLLGRLLNHHALITMVKTL